LPPTSSRRRIDRHQFGRTALYWAEKGKHAKVAEALRKALEVHARG